MQRNRIARYLLAAVLLLGGAAACGYYSMPAGEPQAIDLPVAASKAAVHTEETAQQKKTPLVAAADLHFPSHPFNPQSLATPFINTPAPAQAAPLASKETPLPEGASRDDTPFSSGVSSFSLYKHGSGGPTLLVVGGIQGDEPGGFSAAALIASHYRITAGSVWVVPDLNFPSILQRNRGLFGDMNRKFASLDKKDPQYKIIKRIKSVLLDDQVNLVLNLHDGSGFYRPTWEDPLRNPKRWGQSVIIDQEEVKGKRFTKLFAMAQRASEDANSALVDPDHRYYIHNTETRLGDKEMEKTLSYFAVCNGKPAFGLEASKEFTTEYRSYYHLLLIESFMRQMGIAYERDFELTPKGVLAALNSNLKVAAYDNRLVLPLDNARPTLSMVPFKKGTEPVARASKPLLTLVRDKGPDDWRVAYGNRTLTRVKPAFMEFDESLDSVEMMLDGNPYTIRVGDVVSVKDSFMVKRTPGFRVNAIGAQKERNGTEADVMLVRDDFIPRFSVDRDATTYRVELYKGSSFAGMVLVRFGDIPHRDEDPLTATKGPESRFGF